MHDRLNEIMQQHLDERLGPGVIDMNNPNPEDMLRKIEDINPAKAARIQEECDNIDFEKIRDMVIAVLGSVEDKSPSAQAMATSLALAHIICVVNDLSGGYEMVQAVAMRGFAEMSRLVKELKREQEEGKAN